jgi:hypothetical protein
MGNWKPVGEVWLNPDKSETEEQEVREKAA